MVVHRVHSQSHTNRQINGFRRFLYVFVWLCAMDICTVYGHGQLKLSLHHLQSDKMFWNLLSIEVNQSINSNQPESVKSLLGAESKPLPYLWKIEWFSKNVIKWWEPRSVSSYLANDDVNESIIRYWKLLLPPSDACVFSHGKLSHTTNVIVMWCDIGRKILLFL